jgi:hypothetical protein
MATTAFPSKITWNIVQDSEESDDEEEQVR